MQKQDVLGHPNTRAFVTHCGLHSVHEGMYHGVPLVGVPFMFEQVSSAACSAETVGGTSYQMRHRRVTRKMKHAGGIVQFQRLALLPPIHNA